LWCKALWEKFRETGKWKTDGGKKAPHGRVRSPQVEKEKEAGADLIRPAGKLLRSKSHRKMGPVEKKKRGVPNRGQGGGEIWKEGDRRGKILDPK